jgi:AcrR family transcriptional regulator
MTDAEEVESLVTDPKLVEERRAQILKAATKLFSEQGYYRTTIQAVAKEAGVSTGLIYQYFHDKDDVLFLTLLNVLDAYEREIPKALVGVSDPLEQLVRAFCAYCRIVDSLLDATVLAYRSTKSLRAERQDVIKARETATNQLLEDCLAASEQAGLVRNVNNHLLVYQLVGFCHAWALKQWALRRRYDLDAYIAEGVQLLIEPFLTQEGASGLTRLRAEGIVPTTPPDSSRSA